MRSWSTSGRVRNWEVGTLNKPLTYFCIDIEASGPVPGLFNLVSFGVVPAKRAGDTWVVSDDELYIEVKPDFEGYEPEAERIHGLSREHLQNNGMDSKEAMRRLEAWTLEQAGDTRPLFVGHNAPFDWMYIAYYFAYAGMKNPYGYNALDTKALAMGKLDLEWPDTNKERLAELLPNLPAVEPDKIHNAVYDARYQAHILCELLALPSRKRAS